MTGVRFFIFLQTHGRVDGGVHPRGEDGENASVHVVLGISDGRTRMVDPI